MTGEGGPTKRSPDPDARQAHDEDQDGERYLVVDGRRWRRQDPHLPPDVAARLRSHLGRGRSEVGRRVRAGEDPAPARRRVGLAKHGLGERGTPWWEQSEEERTGRWRDALAKLDALDVRDERPGPVGGHGDLTP